MLDNAAFSNAGLGMRPATAADAPFLETLYRSARPDLQHAGGGDREVVDSVMAQQYRTLMAGTEQHYPNAMHFVVERQGQSIGAVIVDFGANEVRVVYLALVPAARGRDYGKVLMQGIQQAATKAHCPVAVTVWRNNPQARRFYAELGFVVDETHAAAERMVWYPGARPMVSVP